MVPTKYFVSLGFTVDIYDGKVLIDSISRTLLPLPQFAFVVGDELVSVDGTPVQTPIESFRKYSIAANPRSTDRIAAARIVARSQQIMPHTQQGPIVDMRSMGAGGSVVGFNATAYTESIFRITVSLMNRGHLIPTPDFPPAPYIENIGVRPDIVVDYMTRANLMSGGAPFVQAFTQAIVSHALTAP